MAKMKFRRFRRFFDCFAVAGNQRGVDDKLNSPLWGGGDGGSLVVGSGNSNNNNIKKSLIKTN